MNLLGFFKRKKTVSGQAVVPMSMGNPIHQIYYSEKTNQHYVLTGYSPSKITVNNGVKEVNYTIDQLYRFGTTYELQFIGLL